MILTLLAAPVPQPQTVVTVDPAHKLVEGVATDGEKLWVSSLIDRQILSCAARCTTFATVPEGLHPFAIAWDSSRKRLWVAADCPPKVPFIKECERGALIAYDARGRLQTRITSAAGTFHPGDVSAANGEVFVSDSQNGAVYRLNAKGQALSAVVLPGTGKSGQGSALDSTGKRLIVADYSQGITAIDLSTGERSLLLRDNGRPLRGIDGLARCGETFVGIYNGEAPGRLVAFTIAGDKIAAREPIENFTLPDPTQLTISGDRVLIVANSGWEGALKDAERIEGTPIVALPKDLVCGTVSADAKPS